LLAENITINNGTRNSCGVATLFGKEWSTKETIMDNEGRLLITYSQNEQNTQHIVVANIYAPNDHKKAINFYTKVFMQLESLKEKLESKGIEDIMFFVTGDFNYAHEETDRFRTKQSAAEKTLAAKVEEAMKELGFKDCINFDKDVNKFTWQNKRRGQISQSRIDRIYCSPNALRKCKNLTKKWGIGNSDHAALVASFHMEIKQRGKGIPKINGLILNNEEIVNEIKNELLMWLDNIDNRWNPHLKWEYCKLALRSIIFPKMSQVNKQKNRRKTELIDEITKIKNSFTNMMSEEEINKAEIEVNTLDNELNSILDKETELIALKSGIKWREKGERSTKYFLGVLKKRSNDSYIECLRDAKNILRYKKDELLDIAHKFYRNLYDHEPNRIPTSQN
jgi:exonuclease III